MTRTVTEHIRAHLWDSLAPMPDLSELWETEWSPELIEAAHWRMVQGSFRYGRISKHDPTEYVPRCTRMLTERLEEFTRTGNRELLADVVNCAVMLDICGRRLGMPFTTVHDRHDQPAPMTETPHRP